MSLEFLHRGILLEVKCLNKLINRFHVNLFHSFVDKRLQQLLILLEHQLGYFRGQCFHQLLNKIIILESIT